MPTEITTPRTVRFAQNELHEIEAFLRQNQFLDFSNLTRLAIAAFIRNPQIKIHPMEGKTSAPNKPRKLRGNL